MRSEMKRLLTPILPLYILLLLFFSVPLCAQKTQVVEGNGQVTYEGHMTLDDAEIQALDNARKDAINTAFGTVINQHNITSLSNENGHSSEFFNMFGESDLRGTWLSDSDKKIIWINDENGRPKLCKAWIKGKAREVKRAKVEYEWKLLANGIGEHYQVESLHDGDAFYIKFRSPVKGYLLLFLVDCNRVVTCALPMDGQDYCEVQRNHWYVFYYDENNPSDHWIVTMEKKKLEYNQLYVLFSPNKIAPPVRTMKTDNSDLERYKTAKRNVVHLPELSFKDFHKYLGRLLNKDPEVQMEKRIVKITRSN